MVSTVNGFLQQKPDPPGATSNVEVSKASEAGIQEAT